MAKRKPISLQIFQLTFKLVNTLFPALGDKWAIKLFLSPMRAPYTSKGKELISASNEMSIEVNGNTLVGYSLGNGPTVLCVHGWAGKSTQFAYIAQSLNAAGYRLLHTMPWRMGPIPVRRQVFLIFVI